MPLDEYLSPLATEEVDTGCWNPSIPVTLPMVVAIVLPIIPTASFHRKVLDRHWRCDSADVGIYAVASSLAADDSDYDPPTHGELFKEPVSVRRDAHRNSCRRRTGRSWLRRPRSQMTTTCRRWCAHRCTSWQITDGGASWSPDRALCNNKLAMWLFLGSEQLANRRAHLHVHTAVPRPAHTGTPGPAQLWDMSPTSVSRVSALMSFASPWWRGREALH